MLFGVIGLLFPFYMYVPFYICDSTKHGVYTLMMDSWSPCQSEVVMWILEVTVLIDTVTWGQSL